MIGLSWAALAVPGAVQIPDLGAEADHGANQIWEPGAQTECFHREPRGTCSHLCLGFLCGSDFSKPLERAFGSGPRVVTGTRGSFTLGWGYTSSHSLPLRSQEIPHSLLMLFLLDQHLCF